MQIQISRQVTINAPANKVWDVLARDFHNISHWASVITESTAVADVPAPDGAEVGGRVCSNSMPGFGDVQEEFTHYDEQSMRFGYRLAGEHPSFIRSAENNWVVRSLGPNESMVEARAEIKLHPIPGLVLAPILKLQLDRAAVQASEELKYYIERNQPHPRKLKAQQKASRNARS